MRGSGLDSGRGDSDDWIGIGVIAVPLGVLMHDTRVLRAVVVLFALILAYPTLVLGANERGWQAWAFELRNHDTVGWVGTWTPGGCEAARREAFEEKLDASIGVCHPVTLTDEPAGVAVWAVMVDDSGFVAASTPEFCEEDSPSDSPIQPVALTMPTCRQLWLRVPV